MIKRLLITAVCLLAVAFSAMSCAYFEDSKVTEEQGGQNEEKQEQKESAYQKITAGSYSMGEESRTFTDADDYKNGMAEYIAKYENEENLRYTVRVDFRPGYDREKLNVIEYIDMKDNDVSCVTYTIAPEKFDTDLLLRLCEDEDMISIDVRANYGVETPD